MVKSSRSYITDEWSKLMNLYGVSDYICAIYNWNAVPNKQSIYQTISKTRHIEHNYSIAEQTIKSTHNTHNEKLINVNAVYVVGTVYIWRSIVCVHETNTNHVASLTPKTHRWMSASTKASCKANTVRHTYTRNHHSQNPSGWLRVPPPFCLR